MINILGILASICTIIGSAILAYRVTGILEALSFVATAHEHNINQICEDDGVSQQIVFTGSNKHVKRAQKQYLLITGFVFIILGGFLQFISLITNII